MEGYSLKKLFISPFPLATLPYLLLSFAIVGFLDAAYLTIVHYQHAIPPCTIGGCETVLTSQFATVWGIPTALFGAIFYLCIVIGTGVFLMYSSNEVRSSHTARTISTALFFLCTAGLLVGIVLIYIQAFVLHSWCYYCLFSELIDFLLFDASWWLYNSQK